MPETSNAPQTLRPPARYFPIQKGVYEVAPGLRNLGASFGNGDSDSFLFQLDRDFPKYRANKLECRSERLGKYYATSNYPPEVSHAANRFIVHRLLQEHPEHFKWEEDARGGVFRCALTGDAIALDRDYELRDGSGGYSSAFDALCSQIQEDVAILCRAPDGKNWLASLHLCSPSHWAAEDKIGKDFFAIHAPVPGIGKLNAAAGWFVDAMITKGPFVRFVWGFATDKRLNHHPIPAPGASPEEWKGRTFQRNTQGSPFNLRYERQTLHGLPEVQAALFAIHVFFIDGEEIRSNPAERALLRSGLLSMTPESRAYKGITDSMDDLIAWLDEAE